MDRFGLLDAEQEDDRPFQSLHRDVSSATGKRQLVCCTTPD